MSLLTNLQPSHLEIHSLKDPHVDEDGFFWGFFFFDKLQKEKKRHESIMKLP